MLSTGYNTLVTRPVDKIDTGISQIKLLHIEFTILDFRVLSLSQINYLSCIMPHRTDLDSIFGLIGEFGPYQKKRYMLLCVIHIVTSFHMILSAFILATPKHR